MLYFILCSPLDLVIECIPGFRNYEKRSKKRRRVMWNERILNFFMMRRPIAETDMGVQGASYSAGVSRSAVAADGVGKWF